MIYSSLLVLLNIERYLNITRPLRYQLIMNVKRTYLMIVTMWSFSFFCGLIVFFAVELKENHVCTYAFTVTVYESAVLISYILNISFQRVPGARFDHHHRACSCCDRFLHANTSNILQAEEENLHTKSCSVWCKIFSAPADWNTIFSLPMFCYSSQSW